MSAAKPDIDAEHLFIPLALETVAQLEERASALDGIRAVVDMRRWVDWVLEDLVQDARLEGSGWTQIAAALGVSRQAAWERYRDRDGMAGSSSDHHPDGDFLHAEDIWAVLISKMRAGAWYALTDLYALVETEVSLSEADITPDAPGSSGLRWHRNVRNVLQRRKAVGDLRWDGRARYSLS